MARCGDVLTVLVRGIANRLGLLEIHLALIGRRPTELIDDGHTGLRGEARIRRLTDGGLGDRRLVTLEMVEAGFRMRCAAAAPAAARIIDRTGVAVVAGRGVVGMRTATAG